MFVIVVHTDTNQKFWRVFVPLSMHACQQQTCFCCWSCVFACYISLTTWWINHSLPYRFVTKCCSFTGNRHLKKLLTEDIRGRIVTLRELGISVSRIQRVWRNFRLNGIRTTMPRSGRSRVTTPDKTGCWSGTPGVRFSKASHGVFASAMRRKHIAVAKFRFSKTSLTFLLLAIA